MIINKENLQQINTGFKTLFNKAFIKSKPLYQKIATIVPSTTKAESYKWLGKTPRMREWIGERQIQNLGAFDYEIKNKSWETTISLDKEDVEDDSIGIYDLIIQSMGETAAMHPDQIVIKLLPDGFYNKCYDQQPFFSANHQENESGIQNNMGIYELDMESYGYARASMMSLKNDSGYPLKVTPNLLIVPPQLENIAKKILIAENIDSTTNIYKDSAELLVVSELSGHPTKWFLLDTTKPVKPLIFQQRKKPEFVSKDSLEDDNVFSKKEFLYGVDSRDNAGYGLWQLAYGSTGEIAHL